MPHFVVAKHKRSKLWALKVKQNCADSKHDATECEQEETRKTSAMVSPRQNNQRRPTNYQIHCA